MTAVLITGMSAVGKSSVLAELARMGYDTVDTDYGDWIHTVDGEPLWREDRIHALLSRPRTGPLFVQGTVANQGGFYRRFDAVVLLSAPVATILERWRTRTSNDFGKCEVDRAQILADIAEIEPLLRAACTHELDTTRPLAVTVEALINIAEPT